MNQLNQQPNQEQGAALMFIVVFTAIFVLMMSGLISLITYQKRLSDSRVAKIQALHIAEAGINYYRWHLAHDPDDYQDGTATSGPYVHEYNDPTTGLIGTYSLEIDPPETGSTIVTVRSTGWVNTYPNLTKTIEVRYGEPSLAKYAFLTNSDIWLGSDESVSGEFHSNGGIRMDGTNDSLVTSAKETYVCTPSHGCSNETKDGVWGTGPNSDLWNFPVTEVDFATITIDQANLKSEAQSGGHYYDALNYGYHVVFKNDGTYDLYTVTSLQPARWRIDDDDLSGWDTVAEEINNESSLGNFSIPSNGIIFIEDTVWVEGTVNGKVTLASADFPESPSTYTDIYINGNINYVARDGDHALGLVAQKNVLVPRHAPSTLTIDAVMLAQNGRVARLYYWPQRVTTSIEVYGGIITNKIWTWTWVSGSTTVDGYDVTNSIFNPRMVFDPPPNFPTSGNFEIITWEEIPTS